MENFVFWELTLCNQLIVSRRFGGTRRLRHYICYVPVSFLAYSSLRRQLNFKEINGVISMKIKILHNHRYENLTSYPQQQCSAEVSTT
jgi:hypothetical protein